MLKKLALAAALTLTCSAVHAANAYFVVVPSPGQPVAEAIRVTLASVTPPVGEVGKPYAGFDAKAALTVTGDTGYTGYGVKWSLASGNLPAGLTLNKQGAITGTPSTPGETSFQLRASYKTKTGQQVYTIVVNGTALQVTQIAVGNVHTCAITTRGAVKCWGYNVDGRLGDGSTSNQRTPVAVVGLASGVVQIAAGTSHTCALTTGGGVKCWGYNYYGQLGDGTTTNQSAPVSVVGLASGVIKLASGGSHTCAVTSSGGVTCWGLNTHGQLGDGTTTARSSPVDVVGLAAGVLQLAAGGGHTCAVTSGGATCWGDNTHGQLGDGTTTNQSTPAAVSGVASGLAQLALGGSHTCAVTASGGVTCWGYNGNGQLGDGSTSNRLTPVAVVGMASGVTQLAASTYHTCAVTTSGGAKCWGLNTHGQLGDGTTTARLTPVDVVGLASGVTQLSSKMQYICAVTSGGAKCWGRNTYGQLGDGSTITQLTPVDVRP